MFKVYRMPWIDPFSLVFQGHSFFSTPGAAKSYVEDFFMATQDGSAGEMHPFGYDAYPMHGIGGFIMQRVAVPPDSLIAAKTKAFRRKDRMLGPKDVYFVDITADPAIWHESRSLEMIGKRLTVPYQKIEKFYLSEDGSNVVSMLRPPEGPSPSTARRPRTSPAPQTPALTLPRPTRE